MSIFSLLSAIFSPKRQNPQQIPASFPYCGIKMPPFFAPMQYVISFDFELRLRRARTDPLKIVQFYFKEDICISADICNESNGNTYHVTPISCECMDWEKRHLPCKHMIYLALETGNFRVYEKPISSYKYTSEVNADGKFIPLYWNYYSGIPSGIGYTNLYSYVVCGRVYGISEKTGRPTNRKKVAYVNAFSQVDAVQAAKEEGIMPPYEYVVFNDGCPSDAQYAYLHGVGIPCPNFINGHDISALLDRYVDENRDICPEPLFQMATERRVMVSYFSPPQDVINSIWRGVSDSERISLFCYAVYCREKRFPFGCAPIPSSHPIFSFFSPTQKQLKYINSYLRSPLFSLSKNSNAYAAAVEYLKTQAPQLFL